MKNYKFLLLNCFLLKTLVFGQNVYTSKYSNDFLNIGVSAKNVALGNTAVATVNDVTSGYWNPAGLTKIAHKNEISLMHNEYFGGVGQYNYVAGSLPIDSSSRLSISYIRLSIDNIPDTRYLFDNSGNSNTNLYGPVDYSRIKYFSASDNAFIISYGKQNKKFGGAKYMGMYRYGVKTYTIDSSGNNLSYGASFKIINRKVGDFATAWGFGADIGLQLKYQKWFLGAAIRDVTSTFNFWDINAGMLRSAYDKSNTFDSTKQNTISENTLEITLPRAVIGAAWYFNLNKSKTIGLMPSFDIDVTFDGKRNVLISTRPVSIDPKLGLEFNYKKKLFVRTGLNNFQKLKDFDGSHYYTIQPCIGVGVLFTRFAFDYALVNPASTSVGLYSHVFSIKLGINAIKLPK
jgi:hypothetical protein